MPMDNTRYPPDWPAISRAIRDRDGWCCKWCGVQNKALGIRLADGRFIPEHEICIAHDLGWITSEQASNPKYVRIVLTVAHLGTPHADGRPGDKHDKMDCRDENLAALCQRCHLRYDRDEHAVNARRTRLRKKHAATLAAGQTALEVV